MIFEPPQWLMWMLVAIGFAIAITLTYHELRVHRDKLQGEVNAKESQVELTNFDSELHYKQMTRSGEPVIAIRLQGILRNTSMQNHGSLEFFRIEITTSEGFYVANSDIPPLGHKFEPNTIYPQTWFVFIGEVSDTHLDIASWEPFIKGQKARINLAVQGQKMKSYPVKIADIAGFQ